jgi:hypothetical protein
MWPYVRSSSFGTYVIDLDATLDLLSSFIRVDIEPVFSGRPGTPVHKFFLHTKADLALLD